MALTRILTMLSALPRIDQTWTWNPADKDSDVALSSGDRTMTANVAFAGAVRATAGKGGGKNYFEISVVTLSAGANMVQGIGNGSVSIGSAPGSSANGAGWSGDGTVSVDGASVGPYATYAAGDRLGFAFDLGANKLWMAKNNAWQSGNPSLGTGGLTITSDTYFPMGYGINSCVATCPTTILYVPPAGFDRY